MSNWLLFLLLLGISIPGIIIIVPSTIRSLEDKIRKSAAAEKKKIPPISILTFLGIVQTFVLVLFLDAVGVLLTPKIGFRAPFFDSLLEGSAIWSSLKPQILPSLIMGIGGAVVFVAAYYLIFRPRLDKGTVKSMEGLRMKIGFAGRILYGGIVEEIITRWGLLVLIVWLLKVVFGQVSPITIWVSIIISGVLFGLGHLPAYLGAGCRKTPLFLTLMISLNLEASLIFGWLF